MILRFYFFLITLLILTLTDGSGAEKWSKLNFPDNINGVITSLAVRGDNIFVGTDISGMFFSGDAGRNFNIIGENLPKGKIESFTIKQGITHEGNMYVVVVDNLYRSDDGGVNWILIGAFQTKEEKIRCVYITDNEELYVG